MDGFLFKNVIDSIFGWMDEFLNLILKINFYSLDGWMDEFLNLLFKLNFIDSIYGWMNF